MFDNETVELRSPYTVVWTRINAPTSGAVFFGSNEQRAPEHHGRLGAGFQPSGFRRVLSWVASEWKNGWPEFIHS
jgi:hypothetical protein